MALRLSEGLGVFRHVACTIVDSDYVVRKTKEETPVNFLLHPFVTRLIKVLLNDATTTENSRIKRIDCIWIVINLNSVRDGFAYF